MARHRKQRKKQEGGIPELVVTYGDLMSLLLTFFILLAAFSELRHPREYRRALDAIREALGFDGGIGQIVNFANPRNSSVNRLPKQARMAGDARSRAQVNETNMTGRSETVSRVHEGNRWTLGGSIEFQPASHELSESGKAGLREVAELIRDRRNKVLIRGHAWGLEDQAGGFDFIDLSYMRARAVMDYLVNECGIRSEVLMPVAAGMSEPRNVSRDQSDGVAENRRVEVMVTEVMVDEMHPDPYWQGR